MRFKPFQTKSDFQPSQLIYENVKCVSLPIVLICCCYILLKCWQVSMPACLTQHCMLNFNRQACDDEFQRTSIAISMAFPTDDHDDDDFVFLYVINVVIIERICVYKKMKKKGYFFLEYIYFLISPFNSRQD